MFKKLSARTKRLMTILAVVIAGSFLSVLLLHLFPKHPELLLEVGGLVGILVHRVRFTPKFGEKGYKAPIVHEPISEEQLRVLNSVYFSKTPPKRSGLAYVVADPYIGMWTDEESPELPPNAA